MRRNSSRRTGQSYRERDEILVAMGFATYAAYLASQLWAGIRTKVMAAANRACCGCNQRASQVHHDRYTEDNLKGASTEFLHAICGGCHEAIELDSRGGKEFSMVVVSEKLRCLMVGIPMPDRHQNADKKPRTNKGKLTVEQRAARRAAKTERKRRKRIKREQIRKERRAQRVAEGASMIAAGKIRQTAQQMAELARRVEVAKLRLGKAIAEKNPKLAHIRNVLKRAKAALADAEVNTPHASPPRTAVVAAHELDAVFTAMFPFSH